MQAASHRARTVRRTRRQPGGGAEAANGESEASRKTVVTAGKGDITVMTVVNPNKGRKG